MRRAADGGLDVSCTVKNVGARASDEVVQVYLGAPETPPAGVDFAVRALADFERITLRSGEAKRVQLHVAPEQAAILVECRFGLARLRERAQGLRRRFVAGLAIGATASRRR